jgi:hypothetical protein
MQNLGMYNLNNFLPPANPLSVVSGVGFEYVRIINDSPFLLLVNMNGIGTIQFPEFFLEDIYLPSAYLGTITIVPSINISSTSHSVSGIVSVNVYNKGEISSPQAQPLAQPAVNVTATGKPLFTATFEVRSTASLIQDLAVLNPSNSGVTFEFHSAKLLTNDATLPTCNLIYWNANPNLVTSIPAVTHSGWNPVTNTGVATSASTCTASDANQNFFFANRSPDVADIPANTDIELLSFPDTIILNPGVALIMMLSSGTTGHTIRLRLKWTENTVVPALAVTGANAVASSLKNDGSPATTQFIESTPQSIGTSAFNYNVDGSGFHAVDQSGTMHRVETFNTVGNPYQLGAAGDILEALGQLLVDQLLTLANSIKFKTIGQIDAGYQVIGDTTISNTGTTVSHSLGVVPKLVIPITDAGAAGSSQSIKINYGSFTTTTFQAFSTDAAGTGNIRFFVLA